ncbi:DegT/DnrJ/EryC1/StrS family aminotransferase [Candidatus Margulisiibacteriota bacterium]
MIPVFKPCLGKEELAAIKDAMESGWIGLGPKTKEFEEKFAKYIGVKYAVATNSGTAALHLALKVMGVEGREVITTPLTFISTNHAILYNNGFPVFADICPDTLNINPKEIENLITRKTAAIVVVHYGGHSCDMEPIMKLAKANNLAVIEDVAHGCGGEYKGKKLGSIGNIACFSFHAVKNLTTGEGGMITTNDPEIHKRLMKLRWLGISKDTWSREEKDKKYSWQYDVEEIGYKYHMHDIAAAIGVVQLKKLDEMNERRRQIAEKYDAGLSDLEWLEIPTVQNYAKSARHNYVIKVENRDELNIYLQDKEISTGVHYIPNSRYKMYQNCKANTPVCERIWKKLLTLPLYPDLKNREIDVIINEVRSFHS